ncbi:MAG: elongator complex protein 3 [Patescibacteria group bacterium]
MSIISSQTKKAIKDLIESAPKNAESLAKAKRRFSAVYNIKILRNSEILEEYRQLVAEGKVKEDKELERLLRKRQIRTMSGVAPVAVLTKPYPCPGECAYCPDEKDIPKSYLSNEPAVMRAIRNQYNPYAQVQLRLKAMEANGHLPTKIELIVIGGSWSVLPVEYKYWYIKECFRGANDYFFETASKNSRKAIKIKEKELRKETISGLQKELAVEQKKNEKGKYRVVGLTLETRPDFITEQEVWQMREMGCTRVELGVQIIDDEVLKINKRGHGVKEVAEATSLLREYGFKVTYHLMPGLPGSDFNRDLKKFKQLFEDERFRPDQIKFYPTVVTKGSLLYQWWKQGGYKPYTDKRLKDLIVACKKAIPPYVRVIRLIRDIPEESIVAGNKITNLRQLIKEEGVECECIRCREAKDRRYSLSDVESDIIAYQASGGVEYFISYVSKDKKTLFGFCRLRLPGGKESKKNALSGAALVRELHIYGELTPVGERSGKVQHTGLGKKLMAKGEKMAKANGYKKMAVISGVGVRSYYRKMGYRLQETYMVKKLYKES